MRRGPGRIKVQGLARVVAFAGPGFSNCWALAVDLRCGSDSQQGHFTIFTVAFLKLQYSRIYLCVLFICFSSQNCSKHVGFWQSVQPLFHCSFRAMKAIWPTADDKRQTTKQSILVSWILTHQQHTSRVYMCIQ